jgi:iron complex outermembrane receptor protein
VQVSRSTTSSSTSSGFYSKLEATNYNRNWMMWGSRIIGDNRIPTSYTVRNGTLVSATWPNVGSGAAPGAVRDRRRDLSARARSPRRATSTSTRKWRASRRSPLRPGRQTTGKGETPSRTVFEGDVWNTGRELNLPRREAHPADVSFPSGNPAVFTGTTLDWIFRREPGLDQGQGEVRARSTATGASPRACSRHQVRRRWSEHTRDKHQVAQGPNNYNDGRGEPSALGRRDYPGNFGSRLGGGNFPHHRLAAGRRASSSAGATSTRTATRWRASIGRASSRSRRRSRPAT